MQIDQLDHLVLTVQDIQTTCEFYSRVLGMQVLVCAADGEKLKSEREAVDLIGL